MTEVTTPRVAAAILAGGHARRMAGANKAALRVGDRRIIDRRLEVLGHVADGRVHRLAIVSSPRARTLVVACDMPFLSAPLLKRLTSPNDADVVIPRSANGYEPLGATWTAACAGVIGARITRGMLKAAGVVEELRVEEIGPEVLASCDPHGLLFVNVNTPHDYERAQELSRLESNRPPDRIMNVSRAAPKPT